MMTTASLFAFFAKPQILRQRLSRAVPRRSDEADRRARDIELPMWVFVVGIPLVGGRGRAPGALLLRREPLAWASSPSR